MNDLERPSAAVQVVLLPAHPVHARRVDEHWLPEAHAARELGLDVALLDHDLLVAGHADAAVEAVRATGTALYRGWMVSASQYAALVEALARRDVTMLTSATAYRAAHELPGWYDAMAALTPESVWTSGFARDDFDAARAALGTGPAVVRDYAKSEKHAWAEAMFVPELADGDAAWRVASAMIERRGDLATGGIVLRRFERLEQPELRTWWRGADLRGSELRGSELRGSALRIAGAHPDTPDQVPGTEPDDEVLAAIGAALDSVGLAFATVDLVRSAGRWRVIEVGDGQVSDRPASMPAHDLVAAITAA